MTSIQGTNTNYSSIADYRLFLDISLNEGKELLSDIKDPINNNNESTVKKIETKVLPKDFLSLLSFFSIKYDTSQGVTILIPQDISDILKSLRNPETYKNETIPINIAKYHSLPFLLFTSQFKGRKIKTYTNMKNHYVYLNYMTDNPYIIDENSNIIKIVGEGKIDDNTRYYLIEKDLKSYSF
jgi:hypothetical protein